MEQLKPILIVSYFFPPIGMAGSARAYGLFRHLPEFGYRPYVVTVRDIAYPAYDKTLLTEEDERYIIRAESLDPSRVLWRLGRRDTPPPLLASHLSQHLSKWITPDYKRLWAPFAKRAAKRLIARENIGLVMTTSPTPSAHLVGRELCEDCNVDWLADFRDMWVTQPIERAYSRQSQKNKAQGLMRSFRENAKHVTAVNNSIAKYAKADTVIPNGVDPLTCDLWVPDVSARPMSDSRSSDVFRIGYLGTTDSIKTIAMFVSALAKVLEERQLSPESVRVRFVGAVDEVMLHKHFGDAGLARVLECRGYLPRHAAITALADVDALLVTIPPELPFVTPSKVFDCLVSGKPLIVIAPQDSELATLVGEAGERSFASDEQVALQTYIAYLLETKSQTGVSRADATTIRLRQSRSEEYSWWTMAKRFAQVFDGMAK